MNDDDVNQLLLQTAQASSKTKSIESLEQRATQRKRIELHRRGRHGAWVVLGLAAGFLLTFVGIHVAKVRWPNSVDETTFAVQSASVLESPAAITSRSSIVNDAPSTKSQLTDQPVKTTPVSGEKPETVSEPIARVESGPWDQSLTAERIPFQIAWSRPIANGTSAPSMAQLEEWFKPVAGHESRFLSELYRSQQVAGFEGTVQLQAPMNRDAALRLSVPDHHDLRIYLYRGSEGLLIQQNDSNNRANSRLHDLEQQLAQAKRVAAEASRNFKLKADAANGPLKSIQAATKAIEDAKANVVKVKQKLPAAAEVVKQWQAETRTTFAIRTAALREIPRASLRARDATRKVREAEAAARRTKSKDKNSAKRIEDAKKLAKKEAEAQKSAAKAKIATERAWQTADRERRNAEQIERVLKQGVKRTEHVVKAAEQRLRQAQTQAKRILDPRDDSKRAFEAAQAVVDRLGQDISQAKQAAARETANSNSDANAWTAWTTHRDAGQVQPRSRAVVSTDGGRAESTELRHSTEFELRYSEGRVVITRGDVVLLSAPISAAPSEVYFSGRLLIDGIGMIRTSDVDELIAFQTDLISEQSLTANIAIAELTEASLDRMLDDPAVKARPTSEQFALLNEFTLLSDLGTDASKLNRMIERYHRVAEEGAAERGDIRPFSRLRRTLMSAPFGTHHQLSVVHEPLLRQEMLNFALHQQWDEVDRLCRELRFFQIESDSPLIRWAKGMAAQQIPDASDPLATLPDEWRQPLIHGVDKELYSQMAEFDAAISGAAYADALGVATTIAPSQLTQLIPTQSDSRLLQSFESALAGARQRDAEFQQHMDLEFTPKAVLRVNEAIAKRDSREVADAAQRSFGTRAVEVAHAWLGDREMSLGNFTVARNHYQQAQRVSGGERYSDRLALCSAMLGSKVARSSTSVIRLNDSVMTSSEFGAVLDEMTDERGKGRTSSPQLRATSINSVNAGVIKPPLHVQARSEMGAIEPVVFRGIQPDSHVDAVTRRIAVTADDSHLFVNSGCKLTAFNLANGSVAWSSNPTKPGNSPATLTAMQPLMAGKFIFARQWDSAGPSLVCFRTEGGERLWTSRSSENEVVASDPMLGDGKLHVLVAVKPTQQDVTLRLISLDAATGREVASHDLVQLGSFWWRRQVCCVVPLDDSFVASLGGVVLHAKFSGEVRWVRSQVALPAEVDPNWITQDCNSTFMDDDHVYVTQPGVRVIECLDRIDGTLRWRVVSPGIRRILGLSGSSLVVMTDSGVESFDRTTGKLVWTHQTNGPVGGTHCSDNRVVFAQRQRPQDASDAMIPEFVWLDSATGRQVAKSPVGSLASNDPRIGPLLVIRNRPLAIYRRSTQSNQLELIQLTNGDLLQAPAR